MPISLDLAALAMSVDARMQKELKTIAGAFAQLGAWLGERLESIQAFEQQTRGYPELRFLRGALGAKVDASQHGGLRVSASLGQRISEMVIAPFREHPPFQALEVAVSNVLDSMTDYREAMLIPRAITAAARVVGSIEEAINRMTPPTAETFSLRGTGRRGDAIGAMGMAVWALFGGTTPAGGRGGPDHEASGGFGLLLRAQEHLAQIVDEAGIGSGSSGGSGGDTGGSVGIPAMLDTAVRGIAGTLLLLPLLPEMMASILAGVRVRMHDRMLDVFEEIEATVQAMRAQVIEFVLVRLPAIAETAYDVLMVVRDVAVAYVDGATRFLEMAARALVDTYRPFLDELSGFIQRLEKLIRAIVGGFERILDIDLMPILLGLIGYYDWPSALRDRLPEPPVITLRDVVEGAFTAGRTMTQATLVSFLEGVLVVLNTGGRLLELIPGVDLESARVRVGGAQRIAEVLFSDTPEPVLGGPIRLRGTEMPDLFSAFFGSSVQSLASVGEMMLRVQDSAGRILDAGAEALLEMGHTFDQFADRAARMGSRRAYRNAVLAAVSAGEQLFGDQVRMLADRARSRGQADRLARGFEHVVAEEGFGLLEVALPIYVRGMRDYWTGANAPSARFARASELPDYAPTSPHILDRRARLGRVVMNTLTLRVTGPFDDRLAERVASHFKAQVEQAYETGLQNLPD